IRHELHNLTLTIIDVELTLDRPHSGQIVFISKKPLLATIFRQKEASIGLANLSTFQIYPWYGSEFVAPGNFARCENIEIKYPRSPTQNSICIQKPFQPLFMPGYIHSCHEGLRAFKWRADRCYLFIKASH